MSRWIAVICTVFVAGCTVNKAESAAPASNAAFMEQERMLAALAQRCAQCGAPHDQDGARCARCEAEWRSASAGGRR